MPTQGIAFALVPLSGWQLTHCRRLPTWLGSESRVKASSALPRRTDASSTESLISDSSGTRNSTLSIGTGTTPVSPSFPVSPCGWVHATKVVAIARNVVRVERAMKGANMRCRLRDSVAFADRIIARPGLWTALEPEEKQRAALPDGPRAQTALLTSQG